jgi:hypothetical protein
MSEYPRKSILAKWLDRENRLVYVIAFICLASLMGCLAFVAMANIPIRIPESTTRAFLVSQSSYIVLTPAVETTSTSQIHQSDLLLSQMTETPLLPTQTHTPTFTPSPTSFISGPIIYGYSFGDRELIAYRLGHGSEARALVGGIHGGYEWNTTVLVNEFQRYLTDNPDLLPAQLTLYMIPLANPDGAAAGTDRVVGRMNGNGVDLNRNWDHQWQPVASHGPWPVSGGSSPFSEPETASLRDFILAEEIQSVVFYHSAMSEVYPGAGTDTSKTLELAQLMASVIGYRYAPEGIPGQITTGNSADWLTVNGITAVEVDLSSHEDIDWDNNLKALLAFLNWDLPE